MTTRQPNRETERSHHTVSVSLSTSGGRFKAPFARHLSCPCPRTLSPHQYYESNEGKLVDAKGVKARYVRCYSNGSNQILMNCYTEIEVWGLPGR